MFMYQDEIDEQQEFLVKKKDSFIKRLSESFSGSKKSFKQPDLEFNQDDNYDSDEL